MTREITLTQGLVGLVDDEDYERVMAAGKWHTKVDKNGPYAARRRRRGSRPVFIRLHTFVTGWGYVDHINGDGLDNRRSNLRQATHAQNMWNRGPQKNNTSGFKGVTWDKGRSAWQARITSDGAGRYLGRYPTAEAAARAYDAAARELHGQFARLNFPGESAGPMHTPSVTNGARTHCPWSHEYTPENTRRGSRSRYCRTCERNRSRKRRAAMRDDLIPHLRAVLEHEAAPTPETTGAAL